VLTCRNLMDEDKEQIIKELKGRDVEPSQEIVSTVKSLLETVKRSGDTALRDFTYKFDGVMLKDFEVSKDRLKACLNQVEEDFLNNLKEAKENIWFYHESQKSKGYILNKNQGVFMGQRVLPLEKVGVYVPGGTAAYPSSVLMNIIPAKVAGVSEVIMVTPPDKNGDINPYIGAAAYVAGADRVFMIGGAQAVGALAYGTESIPKVDKIVGPGNVYVATAKKLVYGEVDIDMIAGPSEILVIADEGANPRFIAADLLSQAEHDKLACSILITTSYPLYEKVCEELKIQSSKLERREIIEASLKDYGMAFICKDLKEAIEISNAMAPEHLELMVENPMELLGDVKNAGSVFLGYYTPEPVGDYFGGTNHVLPTNGTARFFSPLSVESFTKKSSFIYYSKEAILSNGQKIITLAEKEGLTAHGNSVKVRLEE
jgi:histidinol dehydrogenase